MTNSIPNEKIDFNAIPKDALLLLLKGKCHLGNKQMLKKMAPYVYKKSSNGSFNIFDLNKTWQKIRAAARLLVAIEDVSNICLVASTIYAKRSIFKFSQYTGSYVIPGRFTPGTFTNQICQSFREPSILITCDPDEDRRAITEASYVNVPVIALCNTNSNTENVDLVIPCNNKNKLSVAPIFYLLSRELLRMKNKLSYSEPWEVAVDLFIFKTPEEIESLVAKDKLAAEKEKLLKLRNKRREDVENPKPRSYDEGESKATESSGGESQEEGRVDDKVAEDQVGFSQKEKKEEPCPSEPEGAASSRPPFDKDPSGKTNMPFMSNLTPYQVFNPYPVGYPMQGQNTYGMEYMGFPPYFQQPQGYPYRQAETEQARNAERVGEKILHPANEQEIQRARQAPQQPPAESIREGNPLGQSQQPSMMQMPRYNPYMNPFYTGQQMTPEKMQEFYRAQEMLREQAQKQGTGYTPHLDQRIAQNYNPQQQRAFQQSILPQQRGQPTQNRDPRAFNSDQRRGG